MSTVRPRSASWSVRGRAPAELLTDQRRHPLAVQLYHRRVGGDGLGESVIVDRPGPDGLGTIGAIPRQAQARRQQPAIVVATWAHPRVDRSQAAVAVDGVVAAGVAVGVGIDADPVQERANTPEPAGISAERSADDLGTTDRGVAGEPVAVPAVDRRPVPTRLPHDAARPRSPLADPTEYPRGPLRHLVHAGGASRDAASLTEHGRGDISHRLADPPSLPHRRVVEAGDEAAHLEPGDALVPGPGTKRGISCGFLGNDRLARFQVGRNDIAAAVAGDPGALGVEPGHVGGGEIGADALGDLNVGAGRDRDVLAAQLVDPGLDLVELIVDGLLGL